MKKYFSIAFMALIIFGFAYFLRAEKKDGEEVVESYPIVKFKVDFEDVGSKLDTITVTCKKVKDYSTDPETNEKSNKKFIWYHFRLTIVSPSHETLWDDEFSSKADDYRGMFDHFGLPFLEPEDYLKGYFSQRLTNLNGIEKRKIDKDEIDDKLLRKIKKGMKSKEDVKEVEKEMLVGKHTVVYYRGDWAEDLRSAVYSKKLHSSFGLTGPY